MRALNPALLLLVVSVCATVWCETVRRKQVVCPSEILH
jgi:hypothetical protein